MTKIFRSMCTPKKLLILFIFVMFVFPTVTVFVAQSKGHPDAISIQSSMASGSTEISGTLNLKQRVEMQNSSFDYPIHYFNNHTLLLKSGPMEPPPGIDQSLLQLLNRQDQDPVASRYFCLIQLYNDITNNESDEFGKLGVEFEEYVPMDGFFVAVPPSNLLPMSSLRCVRSVSRITPEMKIEPTLLKLLPPGGTAVVRVRIVTFNQNATLESKFPFISATSSVNLYVAEINSDQLLLLANENNVKWIEQYFKEEMCTAQSVYVISANKVWGQGNTGTGINVGISDSGIDPTHPYFSSTPLIYATDYVDGGPPIDDAAFGHGTHVAGIIAGSGTYNGLSLKGVAYGSSLVIQRIFDGARVYHGPANPADLFNDLRSHGAQVISCSWGHDSGRMYDYSAQQVDQWIRDNGIMVVFANGNWPDVANMMSPALAKNVIAVGATIDGSDSSGQVSYSSSQNVDQISSLNNLISPIDGRTKPDINAPGEWITSTIPWSTYATWRGTSMATPHVSATVALMLRNYGTLSPALIKAMILNDGVDLRSKTGQTNYPLGWGKLDAYDAIYWTPSESVAQYAEGEVGKWPYPSEQTFSVNVPSASKTFKVTMTYSDKPGSINANPALVNDLDLEMVSPSGNHFYSSSAVNNVEQIIVASPETGSWTIKTKVYNIPGLLDLSQKYALSWSVAKYDRSLATSVPTSVSALKDQNFPVTATISVPSTSNMISGVYAQFRSLVGSITLQSSGGYVIGNMWTSDTSQVSAQFMSSQIGTFSNAIEVTIGSSDGGGISKSYVTVIANPSSLLPSSISVSVNPSTITLGSGTTISGQISSNTQGDLSGTVYLQYSTDGSSWNSIGSTSSSSSGSYSYWWTLSSTGTFYVRAYWNGNSQYSGATSTSVVLAVNSPGGNLADHTMCKGVQPNDPWNPITRTSIFYTDDPAAYSWLNFVNIYDGPHYVHWDWYDPDGQHWTWDTTIPAPSPGQYWISYKVWSYLYPLHFADSKLGRTFTTKVYYDSNLAVTETWTVIKHQSSISVSLSSNSITYGQSVTIGSQLSPSFSDGTTTLQYSTDGVNWNNLASGTPSNGYYSYTWTPTNTGTYYFHAVWSGDLDNYGSTSSTQTLSVNKASTSLTTSASSSTITYGSSVTITASISPALQGKSVTIQYSLDGSTWFYLSSGTTNSAGQYPYSWTPDAGVYYLRSTWSGDANYYGATSPGQQLTVNKASTSTSCSLSTYSINYGENVTIIGTVSVSVNDGTVILENSTDGANWNLISSGTPSSGSYQYTWTPTGGGTFYIRATWSGNNNYLGSTSSSQTLNVLVDTTPPVVIISCPANGGYIGPVPMIWVNGTVTEDNKGTHVPLINDTRLVLAQWESATGKFAFKNGTTIPDASIPVRVNFTDIAGNTGFDTVFFTLDTKAPIVAITSLLSNSCVKGSVWVNATILETNPFSYVVALNGTPVSSGLGQASWQWVTTLYSDGTYVVNVTATDAGGNTGWNAVTVTADNTPPTVTINSPAYGSYLNYSTLWINATLTDATSGIDSATINMSLNGAPTSYYYANATGLLSHWAVGVANGNITVTVVVQDLAGNTANVTWWFVIDVTPPVINVVSPTPSSYLNVTTIWINATLTDATSGINASTIAMTLNASLVPCNFDQATGRLSYHAVFLADGLYTVNVSVRDIAGNLAANSWNFKIDTTEPVVTILYPTEGANVTITPTLWINGTVTEMNMGTLTPSINDSRFNLACWDFATGKFAFSNNTVISEGPIRVKVNFTDLAGNTGLKAVTFNLTPQMKLDTRIVFTLSPNPAYVGQMVTLLGNLTESDTGMPMSNVRVDLYVNGTFKANLWTNANGWFQGSGYTSSGVYQISVTYSGNATLNPSSRTETLTIYVATIKVWTDKTAYHA
ncbi:MAG: S8 family serine peptidase, partial [Candidatus Bathyarchaeia archaeon]